MDGKKEVCGVVIAARVAEPSWLTGDSFREPAINALVSWGLFGIEL